MTERKSRKTAKAAVAAPVEAGWVSAGDGYTLALDGRKLVCRNAAGKQLAAIPKAVQQGEAAQQLLAVRDWLDQHQRACLATVDGWMLRSLPVPRAVIEAVFPDPAWRAPLENAVIWAIGASGAPDVERCGFLRAADPVKGLGVVDPDGETQWLEDAAIAIPHPILLNALDELRELATQLGVTQGIAQLFRETFPRAAARDADATRVSDFAGGKFAALMHASGKAKTLGYRVRGGFACCPVLEGGRRVEARFWIGADSPEAETFTGDLCFVDERERPLALANLGPVAFSEGMRMATAVYGGRVVEKEEG